MLNQLLNGYQHRMHLPESISINKNVFVQKIEQADLNWIHANIPPHILSEVYSNHESISAFEQEIQWTTNYFILDQDGVIFGIIRVIPELNDIVSLHGMGWPNQNGFSRNYLTAWLAMTQILLEKYPWLHSNCRSNNMTAFRILEQTGFQFSHFGFHDDLQQRSIFFKLDYTDFKNSKLAKIIPLQSIDESKPRTINFINSQPKHQTTLKKRKFQFNKTPYLQSTYLLSFKQLLLNQTSYTIKLGKKSVEILSIDFNSFKQHHISPVHEITFSEWLTIRLLILEKLNIEPADLLMMYTNDQMLLLNCFADLLIPMGINLTKEKSVWRINP